MAENYLDNFRQDISASPEVIFAIPLDITHASHNYLSSKAVPQSGLEAYGCTGSAQMAVVLFLNLLILMMRKTNVWLIHGLWESRRKQ